MTRAELMRHALSQALRRVHIGPKKLKLDEETRWQIAGEAVEELRRYGGWKELDEEEGRAQTEAGLNRRYEGQWFSHLVEKPNSKSCWTNCWL